MDEIIFVAAIVLVGILFSGLMRVIVPDTPIGPVFKYGCCLYCAVVLGLMVYGML